jgi:serine/threonine protein kinase/Tfp pilus assembly protein PilF
MTESSLPEESIFAQALEITSTAERAAFLNRACGNNQALRVEVEALLRAHEQSGDLLDLPEKPPVTTDLPGQERPGTLLGPYKLLEQIGEGGMGTVWMAEQTEPIQRRVAVKVVKEGMDSRQVLARFEAERQALALMEHPNIAKVLDAGQTPSGRPYFVMELVKGKPITKYCDEKRLDVRQRLELFGDVCRAVQHAHQKGIIHRDLKPSNVLVAPYDGRPAVKVIDFGVAKATGQRLTDKTLFTGFGALVGTPEYMSPEQAEVNNQDIDTRSDIYSLGVILYELLTGSTPLTRQRVKEVALLEVLRVIREDEPPRPSTRLSESKDSLASISAQRQTEPAMLTRQVRGELDWIVMKALEKDRNRRYETANGFAMDVQRYLADEPVLACPPSVSYRLRKFLRRYKKPVLAASAMLFLLVTAIVGTSIGLVRALDAERQTRRERDDKEEARRQTRQALNTMTDEVIEELLGAQVQLTDKHREFLNKVLEYHAAFAAASGDDPEGRHSRADGFFRVGSIRFFLGDLKEAEAAFREAVALQKQLADEFPDRLDFHHDLGLSHHHLGMLLSSAHRREEAEAAYREAVIIHEQLTAESTKAEFRSDLAKSKSGLGYALLLTDQPEEAEKHFLDARAIGEQLAREWPDEFAYQQGVVLDSYNLSMLLFNTNRPKEAEEVCRHTVELGRQLAAKFSNRPEFRHDLAQLYAFQGVMLQSSHRPGEAEKAWREAVKISKELVAKFPARTEYRIELALALNNLGKLLMDYRHSLEADEVFRETVALFERLVVEVPTRPDFRLQLSMNRLNMGVVFYRSKRWKEAEQAWNKSLEVGKQLIHDYPDRHFYRTPVIMCYSHLALLQHETGRPAQAEDTWREILELSKPVTRDKEMAGVFSMRGTELQQLHGPLVRIISLYRESLRLDNTNPETHFRLGNALKTGGQTDEAIFEHREAIRIQKDYPEAHVNLGNALKDKGRLDEAIAEFREAIATKEKFPEAYKAHYGLGNALMAKRQPKEAIAEYQTAIRLNNDFADAHYSLGNAFFPLRLEEAITEYREAIRIDKNYAPAHTNLGNSLATKGDLDGAIRAYRTALGINKNLFEAHLNLGTALRFKNQLDEAIPEYQEAIRLRKNNASAHDHLGLAWQAKGRLPDALAEFREALRLEKNNAGAKEHLREAERLAQLQERLSAVLADKDKPKDAGELLAFAQLCQAPYRQQYAAAVRFYGAAFTAEPKLSADPRTMHRYNAACAAVQTGCGQGKDADKLDAKESARLRRQALDWLRADLEAWVRLLNQHQDMIRPLIAQQMRHWQADTDFAGVRGPEALAKLPEAERQLWQKLWDDVANTLARAQQKTKPEKKSGAK